MSEPFIGEIRLMSYDFAPKYWASCNGQILPINQNQALFSLLGTTYGGDGRTTFALPDLRGRVPIHFGVGHTLGERGGQVMHTLSNPEMPTHTHALMASQASGSQPVPGGVLGGAVNVYARTDTGLTTLMSQSISGVGGSQGHENRQPYLGLNFCIAIYGIFPSWS